MNLGDVRLGDTVTLKFTTRSFTTGAPASLTGGAVAVYPDASLTELTAGVTLTADFDGRTGLNHVSIVASAGNGFAAGSTYHVVLTAGTVGGVSVAGEVVGAFSIEARQIAQTAADKVWASSTRTLTSFGTLVADIWAHSTRTLTSFGTLVSDIWSASTRTLTSLGSAVDEIFTRDLASFTGEASRSLLNAVRALRNRVRIASGQLTVYREDDTTPAWTASATSTTGAAPLTEIDPT
ncbi:MAG TPA: hypothetical protein VNK50_13090 [Calidithermus sp.]|nr:hypothetical protein [Calidithermus sp.]